MAEYKTIYPEGALHLKARQIIAVVAIIVTTVLLYVPMVIKHWVK